MSSPAALIATAEVRAAAKSFAAWKARHVRLCQFPGFTARYHAAAAQRHVTIIWNSGPQRLTAWQQSKERARIIGELLPLVAGATSVGNEPGRRTQRSPDNCYLRDFSQLARMETRTEMGENSRCPARYPGYRECISSRQHRTVFCHWTPMLRFDTYGTSGRMLAAPERANCSGIQSFIGTRTVRSPFFPGWFP